MLLAVAYVLVLAVAPAQASLGVDTYWGNAGIAEAVGGRFSETGPNGIAVYEATGDVYAADTGFNRVQQFDADGNFIRAWGFDVSAPAASPESSATFETCTEKTQCKNGVASGTALGGKLSKPAGIAVNQANGHVYVADTGFNRVQEFTATGDFVRTFGQDVVGSGPGNTGGYEICVAANGDTCQAGSSSGGAGGVLSGPGFITVAPDGAPNEENVLVTDPAQQRVQEFTATGNFVRAFGGDVVQSGGTGDTAVNEQQQITLQPTLAGGTFTLAFEENPTVKTAALPASATSSEVETALAALASIGGAANVDVSGPAGGPWTVEFTGALANVDVEKLIVAAATVALGTQLSCSSATSADNTSFQWLRNGVPITGATTAIYTTSAASTTTPVTITGDAGAAVQCQVTKSNNANGAGSTQVSNPAAIVATPSGSIPIAPNTIAAPAQTGSLDATVTRELTCNAGTWTNSPISYTYQWYRNGVPFGSPTTIATTSTKLTLLTAQQTPAAVFQCGVTGTNANGSVTKVSGNRATSPAPANPPGVPAPSAIAPPPSGTVVTMQEGSRAFEVCTVISQCQQGFKGSGSGQFAASNPTQIAEDASGNIYTVEPSGNLRIQKFTLLGNVVTPQGPWLCSLLCGTVFNTAGKNSVRSVAVDGQGMVYVAKDFPPGTGDPPVEVPSVVGSEPRSQRRILKIDPSGNGGSGQLVETINANTGQEKGVEGDGASYIIENIFSLAPTATGKPLYMASPRDPDGRVTPSRILRLDEISGPSGSVSTTGVGATTVTLAATIEPAETLGHVKTLYRFEYRREGTSTWLASPSADVSIGNGSDGGESNACTDQQEAAICHVSGEIDGLELGRTYQYRLLARTSYRGSVLTTPIQEFTTEAVSPSVETGSAVWSGPPSTNPSLTFSGRVNPQGGNTTYAFQYVTQADYATSEFAEAQIAPVAPISAGHGAKALDVVVSKNGLNPDSEYRFRLVASNLVGTTTGNVSSIAASHAGDRFIELVSDGDSQGASVGVAAGAGGGTGLTVSDDGERAAFKALTFGEDQQAAPWIITPAIAQRGASGWTTTSVAGDPSADASGGLASNGSLGNAEVTQRLWGTRPAPQTVQWAVRKLDGSLTPISPVLSPLDRTGNFELDFQGGSNDLSTLVLSDATGVGKATLFPGEPLLSDSASNLYKVSGAGTASPSVSLLNRADGGGVIGGACGASLGAGGIQTNAVSADGSVAYFSARAGAAETGACNTSVGTRIFKRIGDASAIEVSACAKTLPATCPVTGNDLFWGASADGSKIIFTTARQLTDSDSDTANDLYVYDESLPAPERLIQASAGEVVPTDHPTIGSGAEVQGVADFAMDGSRVYFVAKGRLTAEAATAANNLYVFERDADHPTGRIKFITVLGDPDLWENGAATGDGYKRAYALPRYEGEGAARVDGDGHLFLFASNQPLLPAEDLDVTRDIYRYDDEMGQMACLSCAGDATLPAPIAGRDISSNAPDQVQLERVASEDGSRVVIRTKEQLLPAVDTNEAEDAYLWDEGTLSLVSGATADVGISSENPKQGGGVSISPDGRTVFFATTATLLPQDLDNGAVDIYAARVDGGFRQEDVAVACSSEDACRTATPTSRPEAQSPGSASFNGAGNVPAKRCGKNKVPRGGKCVPKHKKPKHRKSGKGKKEKGRAGSGRGAGR